MTTNGYTYGTLNIVLDLLAERPKGMELIHLCAALNTKTGRGFWPKGLARQLGILQAKGFVTCREAQWFCVGEKRLVPQPESVWTPGVVADFERLVAEGAGVAAVRAHFASVWGLDLTIKQVERRASALRASGTVPVYARLGRPVREFEPGHATDADRALIGRVAGSKTVFTAAKALNVRAYDLMATLDRLAARLGFNDRRALVRAYRAWHETEARQSAARRYLERREAGDVIDYVVAKRGVSLPRVRALEGGAR